jgi:hypothetical protein
VSLLIRRLYVLGESIKVSSDEALKETIRNITACIESELAYQYYLGSISENKRMSRIGKTKRRRQEWKHVRELCKKELVNRKVEVKEIRLCPMCGSYNYFDFDGICSSCLFEKHSLANDIRERAIANNYNYRVVASYSKNGSKLHLDFLEFDKSYRQTLYKHISVPVPAHLIEKARSMDRNILTKTKYTNLVFKEDFNSLEDLMM